MNNEQEEPIRVLLRIPYGKINPRLACAYFCILLGMYRFTYTRHPKALVYNHRWYRNEIKQATRKKKSAMNTGVQWGKEWVDKYKKRKAVLWSWTKTKIRIDVVETVFIPQTFFFFILFFSRPQNSITHANVVVEGFFVCVCVCVIYGLIHRCKRC